MTRRGRGRCPPGRPRPARSLLRSAVRLLGTTPWVASGADLGGGVREGDGGIDGTPAEPQTPSSAELPPVRLPGPRPAGGVVGLGTLGRAFHRGCFQRCRFFGAERAVLRGSRLAARLGTSFHPAPAGSGRKRCRLRGSHGLSTAWPGLCAYYRVPAPGHRLECLLLGDEISYQLQLFPMYVSF